MRVNSFSDCEAVIENEMVEARRRFVSEKTVAVEIRIQPGGEIPNHSTPESVFMYVLSGNGLISIDGNLKDVTAGMVAECPADIDKFIKNNSKKILILLVVKMD